MRSIGVIWATWAPPSSFLSSLILQRTRPGQRALHPRSSSCLARRRLQNRTKKHRATCRFCGTCHRMMLNPQLPLPGSDLNAKLVKIASEAASPFPSQQQLKDLQDVFDSLAQDGQKQPPGPGKSTGRRRKR